MSHPLLAALAILPLAQAAPPDPTDPKQSGPPVRYESVFDEYRPYKEPGEPNWREQNDEMGRLRGHAGQLKSEPMKQESAKEKTAPAPMPPGGGHAGHP